MKTYTFAAADAPVQEHMAGLVKLLDRLAEQSERQSYSGKKASEKANAWTRAETLRDVISMIVDSNSI